MQHTEQLESGPIVILRQEEFASSHADAVRGHVREIVARGWVEELAICGDVPATLLTTLAQISRETGRPLHIEAPIPAAELPPLHSGELWIRSTRDGWSWTLRLADRAGRQRWLKRALDLALVIPLLIFLSPLCLLLALAVRLSSPGPIFYAWRVLGRNGRPFTGYKFRTMVRDADALKARLMERNEMVGPVFKLARDPRLTPLGRWLRRYSLDELPQLWSVLKGDMSLVGPRPPFRDEYQNFTLWQMRKLSVTPGITCLWQVSGRNRIRDFAEWARLDLRYIDHWSLWLDLKILTRTLAVVLRGSGL